MGRCPCVFGLDRSFGYWLSVGRSLWLSHRGVSLAVFPYNRLTVVVVSRDIMQSIWGLLIGKLSALFTQYTVISVVIVTEMITIINFYSHLTIAAFNNLGCTFW